VGASASGGVSRDLLITFDFAQIGGFDAYATWRFPQSLTTIFITG
jgi:hypothetical protein